MKAVNLTVIVRRLEIHVKRLEEEVRELKARMKSTTTVEPTSPAKQRLERYEKKCAKTISGKMFPIRVYRSP
jgi:hypothetical protein